MLRSLMAGTLGLLAPFVAAAQNTCSSTALPEAARAVGTVRTHLRTEAVAESDPNVPPAIAMELAQMKAALTQVAGAAFACAGADATPEKLQTTIAEALHANRPGELEPLPETKGRKDVGTYGSDLAVQVFQLFSRPRFFEVDFRYGIECGDDNLLLVFEAGNQGWRQRLRWDASQYKTVGDAFGDFSMLTPVTGSYKTPVWRFVVAHGHPSCTEGPHESRFDMDLLTPSDDPVRPSAGWHFGGAYLQGGTVPRLATTEDTIEMRFAAEAPVADAPVADTAKAAAAAGVYRFHLNPNGQVQPLPATASNTQAPVTSSPRSTPSPAPQ